MFIMLNPIPQKRKGRKKYPRYENMGDIYYYILDLPIIKNQPQWKGIIGNEPLLMEEKLKPPPEIKTFGSEEWVHSLSAEYFKKRLKKNLGDCIIYDKNGYFKDYIPSFAAFSKNLAILTKHPKEFQEVKETCFYELGMDIKINSFAGLRSGLSFMPFGTNGFPLKDGFEGVGKKDVISSLTLPKKYKDYLPKGVSPLAFSEALFLKCGIGKPQDYIWL